MIKLKSKDYDLKSLFQYDLLRDILLSLAEYQNDIHSEIIALKNDHKLHDARISKLEEKNGIKFEPSEININIANFESSPQFELTQENKDINNKEEKDEKESQKKDESEKTEENQKTDENAKKDENKEQTEKDIFMEHENDESEEDQKNKKVSSKFENLLKNNIPINQSTNTQNQSSQLNQDLIRNMMKNIRENTEKIVELESQLNKQFERQLKKAKDDLKRDFSSQLLQYKSTFKIFENRINEINQKDSEQDKAIEDLTVKSSNIDIFSMFRDSGDGSIDMAKVLVKALEEKVFKKFDLIDMRYKQEANEALKIKKMMENIQPIVEKGERDINDLKENGQKMREEIDNLKELFEENNKKFNEALDEKENTLNQKIDEFKNNMEKMIKENDENLNNKIKESLKNMKKVKDDDEEDNEKLNNIYDEDTINLIEKKISDLRKKTNDLDNSFKLFMKDSDIEEIKKSIKDLKLDMDQKITKESLKELYNLHLKDVGDLGDLREHLGILFDDLRKNMKSTTVLTNKVESILGNLVSLKENRSGGPKQIIDLSKYIDTAKLNEVIKTINKKEERIYGEIDSLRRDLTDLQIECKDYEKKERVNRLEEDIYKQINERKSALQKAKNELYKVIKNLEVQIKALNEEMKKKQDADSWLLAKSPIKCFNCATCDAHIKNEGISEEYISWNKYPAQNDKNRFGRGFSHMLQMMTYDFINSPDSNISNNNQQYIPLPEEYNNQPNESTNLNSNNSLVIENSKYSTQNKIAQIERSSSNIMKRFSKREIGKSSVPKNGRLKLPKMFETNRKFRNEESLHYDDEKNNINVNESYNYNDKVNENESPKIIKITKKKGNQNMYSSYVNSPTNHNFQGGQQSNLNIRQRNKENPYNNQNDKHFSQTIPIP